MDNDSVQVDNFSTNFFGIGIQNGKTPENLGVLWRTAQNLGAHFIFTIGKRYAHQASDTHNSVKSMPYYHYKDFNDFFNHLPKGVRIVSVEKTVKAENLEDVCLEQVEATILALIDMGFMNNLVEK